MARVVFSNDLFDLFAKKSPRLIAYRLLRVQKARLRAFYADAFTHRHILKLIYPSLKGKTMRGVIELFCKRVYGSLIAYTKFPGETNQKNPQVHI